MAYRLKHRESVPDGVKRIAREELGSCIRLLRDKTGVSRDEAIHEVRKSIKKVRALLRLVRPELGNVYAAENATLRDAGRKLSELRDAEAIIAAFDELKGRSGAGLERGTMASLRRALTLHKKHLEQELETPQLTADVAGILAPCLRSVAQWPLETAGFAAIGPGLEKTYRDGKRAFAVARKDGTRDEYHKWRKRVKDHWYHVRLLEDLWSDAMKGYEQSLKELERALGEDLNLAILRDRIAAAPSDPGRAGAIKDVLQAIEASRKDLRQSALDIGKRVYAEKPRQLVKQMEKLWEAWCDAQS